MELALLQVVALAQTPDMALELLQGWYWSCQPAVPQVLKQELVVSLDLVSTHGTNSSLDCVPQLTISDKRVCELITEMVLALPWLSVGYRSCCQSWYWTLHYPRRAHSGVGTSSGDGSNSGAACRSGGVGRVGAGLGSSSGPGLPCNSEIGVGAHIFYRAGFLAWARSDL